MKHATLLILAFLVGLTVERPAFAQVKLGVPDEVKNVGVDEHPNALLPLDEMYVDEEGNEHPLSDFFRGEKPVLISFNYSNCPKLCDAQLNGLVRTLQSISLKPGKDFEYISMSIDPNETPDRARKSRNTYVERYGDLDTTDGWNFLTGSEEAIKRLTTTCGFRYEFVPRTNEFAHAPVFVVCTPEGRVSRYLYGVEIEPKIMRLSLIESADGEIGNSMDQVILWCFNYDPDSNSYVLQAVNLMKLGGIFTVIVITAICVPFWFTRPRRGVVTVDESDSTPDGFDPDKSDPDDAPHDDAPHDNSSDEHATQDRD